MVPKVCLILIGVQTPLNVWELTLKFLADAVLTQTDNTQLTVRHASTNLVIRCMITPMDDSSAWRARAGR